MDNWSNDEGVEKARAAVEAHLSKGPVEVVSAATQVVAGGQGGWSWVACWRHEWHAGVHASDGWVGSRGQQRLTITQRELEHVATCLHIPPAPTPPAPPQHLPLPPLPGTNYLLTVKAGGQEYEAKVWGEQNHATWLQSVGSVHKAAPIARSACISFAGTSRSAAFSHPPQPGPASSLRRSLQQSCLRTAARLR